MENKTTIFQKMQQAKKHIKETKLKKAGFNSFSQYHYFTPEQIEQLVHDACEALGLFTKFDLIRNELGVYGLLSVIDAETADTLEYNMATAIPEIKATNIAQQLGGCATYTERYLKQTAFGISENVLDFDAQKQKEGQATTTPTAGEKVPQTANKAPQTGNDDLAWLNLFDKQGNKTAKYDEIEKALAEGKTFTLAAIRSKYKVSKQVAEELKTNFNIS